MRGATNRRDVVAAATALRRWEIRAGAAVRRLLDAARVAVDPRWSAAEPALVPVPVRRHSPPAR